MPDLPQLTDGRILLRPHRREDCEALHTAVTESVQEAAPWLQWCHPGYSRAEAEAFIRLVGEAWAQRTRYPFAITAAKDGAFLGGIEINQIVKANRLANVGYWIRTSCTRQGIASAALRLAAQYAFGALGLTRLEIVCLPTNLPSRRVAEKAGARFEALSRNRIVMHGIPRDAVVYGLLPQDVVG